MKFEEVVFEIERTELVRELIALGIENYKEAFPGKDVNVDWHQLAVLVSTKIAHCVVARDPSGKIVGYQVWEHYTSWVERGTTIAGLRAIYMTPEARVGTNFARFFSWGMNHMKDTYKPSDIRVAVDVGNVLDGIVPRLGFVKMSTVYTQQGWVD